MKKILAAIYACFSVLMEILFGFVGVAISLKDVFMNAYDYFLTEEEQQVD
jgi:hypothetical protein